MYKIPKVVITRISPRWSYFQYFILGLLELEKQGLIKLSLNCNFFFKLSRYLPDKVYVRKFFSFILPYFQEDSCTLEGYIKYQGDTYSFCIDCADSPYIFDFELLNKVKCYFKMQCPKELNNDGFRITDEVVVPYCDYKAVSSSVWKKIKGPRLEIKNITKYSDVIKPLCVGVRSLGYNNSYKSLSRGFHNYQQNCRHTATQTAMCYFGNAQGPLPNYSVTVLDYDSEGDIMGYWGDCLSHPNCKRAKIADMMNKLGKRYDARVISDGNANSHSEKKKDLIIPLENFCNHISNFQYNVNISGFRLSIPNRFMESFIVGTAIFTDKLFVKWYLPFEEEVVETVEMGYLRDEQVNWKSVEKDLRSLPNISKETVLHNFNSKWAPDVVMKYLVNETIGKKVI